MNPVGKRAGSAGWRGRNVNGSKSRTGEGRREDGKTTEHNGAAESHNAKRREGESNSGAERTEGAARKSDERQGQRQDLSGRAQRAGPRSLEGLDFLVRLGAADRMAWAVALGWSRATAYSHAARLKADGLIMCQPTTRGDGSLLLATRAGALAVGREGLGAGQAQGASRWAHARAVSWVAAFLERSGDEWWSDRELREDPWWRLELKISDPHARGGSRTIGHRADLGVASRGGRVAAYEVELQRKRLARARAVLDAYIKRLDDPASELAGVVYVVNRPAVRRLLEAYAQERGVDRRVRVIDLQWVIEQSKKLVQEERGVIHAAQSP